MNTDRRLLGIIALAALAALLLSAFRGRAAADGYPHPSQLVSIRTFFKFKSDAERDQKALVLKSAPGTNGFVLTGLYFSEDTGVIANGTPHAPRIRRGYDLLEDGTIKWTHPSLGGGDVNVDVPATFTPGLHFAAGSKIQLEGTFYSVARNPQLAEDFMLVTLVGYTY